MHVRDFAILNFAREIISYYFMLKIQNLDHEKSSERISTKLHKRLQRTKTQLWNQRSLKSRRWNSHSKFLYSSFFCQLIITSSTHQIRDFSNMHQSDPTKLTKLVYQVFMQDHSNSETKSSSGVHEQWPNRSTRFGSAKSKILIWPTYYSLLKFKMSEKTIT